MNYTETVELSLVNEVIRTEGIDLSRSMFRRRVIPRKPRRQAMPLAAMSYNNPENGGKRPLYSSYEDF